MCDSKTLKRCANCNRCMQGPTIIMAPHGLDMNTIMLKIMNTLLHTQPGNLTKEVGLLQIILLKYVEWQGRKMSELTRHKMVVADASTATCIPEKCDMHQESAKLHSRQLSGLDEDQAQ